MKNMMKNIDCVSFYVDNLDDGIDFYTNKLGMTLLWRAKASCGLGSQDGKTDLVLVSEHNPTVSFEVEDVETALPEFLANGGKLIYGPFPIDIGKCVVVEDMWENRFCLLDMTNGKYTVDDNGDVTGVK